jgi:accessory gene regulator B
MSLNSLEALSTSLASIIIRKLPGKSEAEIEETNYELHAFLVNIVGLSIVFIISYFLNILNYTFVAFVCFRFIRTFGSGIHPRNSLMRLVTPNLTYIGITYIGLSFQLNKFDISISFIACIVLAYLYAPADTEEKPIVSKNLRRKLKILSCFSIVILYIAALLFIRTKYASIITFSVLAECTTILPAFYVLFNRRFSNYEAFDS